MLLFEDQAKEQGYDLIAGVDEAGRGPLAGPVVAAACILPTDLNILDINDSKKLSPNKRQRIYSELLAHPGVIYGVGVASVDLIDEINIYQATIQAMLEAVSKLSQKPDYLLVDGLQLPHPSIDSLKIIKGDSLSLSIAAASIIAKVTRDQMMEELDLKWPLYGFKKNKAYGTKAHIAAICEHGFCEAHRKTFEPVKSLIRVS